MIQLGIREYIVNNFKDEDINGLNDAIEDSINEHEELTLPGLGVLFEILWNNSNADQKNNIKEIIYKGLKKE